MGYFEAISTVVSWQDAKLEIERHGLFFGDFVADCGDRKEYEGETVLDWLGY